MKLFATTTLITASAFVGSANADVYIDFSDVTTPAETTDVYNTLSVAPGFILSNTVTNGTPFSLELDGAAATTAPLALLDTTGAASGISFSLVSTNNVGYVGDQNGSAVAPFPASLAGIETAALESRWFFAREATADFVFTGLDDSKSYNIVFYGNDTANNNSATINFELTTGSSADLASQDLNTKDNATNVLSWSSVSSDSGSVVLSYTADTEGWLNFMSIAEVPEPSSLALIGLGGLMMLRRRRD